MKSFLDSAKWTRKPLHSTFDGQRLEVEAAEGSDFWQETHYGFKRDSGHALLGPIEQTGSLEVTFKASFSTLYDQAGLMLRMDESNWIKAGIEINDGIPHLAVVVTRTQSDWSLSAVPEWADREVTVRASWSDDAVTIRARCDNGTWNTLRLAPMTVGPSTRAGLYVCSPERKGLRVTFTDVRYGSADGDLHQQPL